VEKAHDTLAIVRAARRAASPRAQQARSRFDWTPASYLAAVRSSESGQMAGLGQFVRWLLTDDKVASALAQRVDVMLALPSTFDPPIGIPEDWYEVFPYEEQQLLLQLGLLAGFVWCRFRPDVAAEKLRYTVEVWYPEHFDYRHHEDCWYVRTVDGYSAIEDGLNGWRLFTPFGAREPWLRGKWMTIAIPALLKHYALDDRARNSEVGALIYGTLDEAGDSERENFRDDLQNLAKETRFVLPMGGKLEMLDRTASGQASVQKETIDWSDSAITLSFLGQNVTTDGAAGFSSGQPQLIVLNAILKAQEQSLSGFVGVKMLSPWLELLHEEALDNWQATNPEFNRIVYQHWPVEIDADQETEASKFDTAMQGFLTTIIKVKEAGLDLTQEKIDELAAKYGITPFKLPATPSARLVLAPTDVARITRVDEGRLSQGLAPIGDERGQLTIGQIDKVEPEPDPSLAPPIAPPIAPPVAPPTSSGAP